MTKSGGNQIYGELFEYFRNYIFDARNFFATWRGSLERNQFGGTVGGPIIKNKLFYFLAYQGTTQASNQATTIEYVPTAAMLEGNFSVVASSLCNVKALTLPASLGFVKNQIAQSFSAHPP